MIGHEISFGILSWIQKKKLRKITFRLKTSVVTKLERSNEETPVSMF